MACKTPNNGVIMEEGVLRSKALQRWFDKLVQVEGGEQSNAERSLLTPVSGDASFRRYFRGSINGQSYILVDAPPDKEDSHPFVTIAKKFIDLGINVPRVYKVDYTAGFMWLEDFGDTLLWEKLDQARDSSPASVSASDLYHQAFLQLLKIQSCKVDEKFQLPAFDTALLHREMTLFKQWFCEDLLGLNLSAAETELIETSFQCLIDSALAQPQICVHRDYHSRNLLYQEGLPLGVIDFQDAVLGPFSYDLVSLLKDCYIAWPREQVNAWALEYAQMALENNILEELNEAEFLSAFDLMGVQRHLKAIGIFSRLYLRDKRASYLTDIPRTLEYIRNVVKEHADLKDFSQWLENSVVPHVEEAIQAVLVREKL